MNDTRSPNLEVVSRIVSAFNAHDPQEIARCVAPDAIADWSESIAPYRGVYRGRDAWREFFERRLDVWKDARWEILDLAEMEGDRVLLEVRLVARGKESGAGVSATATVVWSVVGVEITHARLFQSRKDAEAATRPAGGAANA